MAQLEYRIQCDWITSYEIPNVGLGEFKQFR